MCTLIHSYKHTFYLLSRINFTCISIGLFDLLRMKMGFMLRLIILPCDDALLFLGNKIFQSITARLMLSQDSTKCIRPLCIITDCQPVPGYCIAFYCKLYSIFSEYNCK